MNTIKPVDQVAIQNAALIVLAGISILNAIMVYRLQSIMISFWNSLANILNRKSD